MGKREEREGKERGEGVMERGRGRGKMVNREEEEGGGAGS